LNILVQHPGRQFKAIEGRRTPFTTPSGMEVVGFRCNPWGWYRVEVGEYI
jgi:hypothetical protein